MVDDLVDEVALLFGGEHRIVGDLVQLGVGLGSFGREAAHSVLVLVLGSAETVLEIGPFHLEEEILEKITGGKNPELPEGSSQKGEF